jgi:hypothetical protein
MRLQTAAGWRSLLFTSLLLTGAWGKKDKPTVKSKKFDFIPFNVNYFQDSDVLLFEDGISHNVYRSEDAGENWDMVKGGPEGKLLQLVMHEYDRKRAYIITNDLTHYMTDDLGKTWKSFHADAQATIFRKVMEFHAGDPDRIIFNAMDCTGIFCEETVSPLVQCLLVYQAKHAADNVHNRWLLQKRKTFTSRYCELPLGQGYRTLHNWSE